MKCEIIFDANTDERVVIYAKENSILVSNIKEFVENSHNGFMGHGSNEIIKLDFDEIYCFSVIDNKVYAICKNEKLQLKERLYTVEESLPDYFIKINKSCIVNMNMIKSFDASISGTLKIHLKNGYVDYISRRQLKIVKERIGI